MIQLKRKQVPGNNDSFRLGNLLKRFDVTLSAGF